MESGLAQCDSWGLRGRRIAWGLLMLGLFPFGAVGEVGDAPRPEPSCWFSTRLIECNNRWRFEFGGSVPIISTELETEWLGSDRGLDDLNVVLALGHEMALANGWAMGVVGITGSRSGNGVDGVAWTLRRRLTDWVDVEGRVGLAWTNLGSRLGSPVAGPSLEGSVRVGWFLAGVQYERFELPSEGHAFAASVSGVTLRGSLAGRPGLVAAALSGLWSTGVLLLH